MKKRKILGGAGAAGLALTATLVSGATPALAKAQASAQPPLVVGDSTSGLFAGRNFNPYTTGTSLWGTNGAIYEPLFYFSQVNGKTWSLLGLNYHWTNKNMTLVVNLRKGVKWNDGKPFTSKDVVYSFDFLKKNPSADGMGVWSHIKNVKAHGNYQVQFNFKKEDPTFAVYLLGTLIIPEHVFAHVKNPTKWTNPNPVATGPYMVKSFSPQVIYLKANPNYWGGEPKVKEVEIPSYNGNQSADLALAKGTFDWAGNFIPNIQKIYVNKDPKNNHYWFPPGAPVMIYPNQKDPLLKQLPVRQAISMAINRQPLYTVAEYGYEPVASATGLVFPNQKQWLDPKIPKSQVYTNYDPQAAMSVLEKAGYKKGSNGIFVAPNGKPLSFNLNVVAGWTDWDEQAQMVAQDLKAVGIQANVRQLQYGDWWDQLTQGKYQLSFSWSSEGPNPFYFYFNLMQPKNPNNWEGWNNGVATKLLEKFQYTTNPKVQKQTVYSLEKYMMENLPAIPLVYGATWYEYRTKNFVGWPTAQNPYVDPAPWSAVGIVLTHLRPAH